MGGNRFLMNIQQRRTQLFLLLEFLIQCGEEVMKIVIDFLVKICITMVTPNLR